MSASGSDDFELIDQFEASLFVEELTKIQQWLQPTDYEAQSSEFNRHLASQAPGTGLWICETSKYQEWQNSDDHGCLWIKGAPGSGKSVTAASIIEHLQKADGVPVLNFFFRYIIAANRRPRSLVRDFLAQLLPYSIRLQAALQLVIGIPLDDFSDERLWEYLLIGLASVEKAYCVVDALDEMELVSGDRFLERLNSLATFRPDSVKVLTTSRPKQYLQSSLRDAAIVHISLEDNLVGKDISLFLNYRFIMLLPHQQQREMRSSLSTLISERADGLFLYARLLLDQIAPKLASPQVDIENLVKDIPIGLEDMYNNMLFQQALSLGIDTNIQVFLLELATHSSRALRLNELASVLAARFPTSMLPDAPKVIAKTACAPLLEILEDETVSVIHHSFTEFLLNADRVSHDQLSNTPRFPALNPDEVHKRLTTICTDYLQAGGLKAPENDASVETVVKSLTVNTLTLEKETKETDGYNYQEARLQHPFLEYAVGNWAYHAGKYNVKDDEFFNSLAAFMDPDSADFKKWLKLEWMKNVKTSEIKVPTPLHVAAYAGLTFYAEELLRGGTLVDSCDAEERTPLHWACTRGNTSMVSLLLQSGATPDPEDRRGVKPIHEAARKNHAKSVRMLLAAGVDPLTPKLKENFGFVPMCGHVSTKGETAVEYVYLQGHVDTIIEMIPYLTSEALKDLFCQCCRYGKFEAVRTLLKDDRISPNSMMDGGTALYLACRAKSVEIVQLLLAKGADVHQISEWKVRNRNCCGSRVQKEPVELPIHGLLHRDDWTPANNLACRQILHLLQQAGTDINAIKDSDGDTPLFSLFSDRNGRTGTADFIVVQALLQAGADCLGLDQEGNSILITSLRRLKDIRILKLLLEYGASVDFTNKAGDSALHTASSMVRGSEMNAVIKLLLEKGARCDLKNKKSVTPVENAAANSHCSLETFAVLVQACPDAAVLQNCLSELSASSRKRFQRDTKALIRVLLESGAKLEHRDLDGRTVLLKSVNTKDLFTAFLECGSDSQAVDYSGKGVLHHFFSNKIYDQRHNAVQRLVDMVDLGLDPLQLDYEGNTLLHLIAKHWESQEVYEAMVEKLIEYGISVNSRNHKGLTPLHMQLDNWDHFKRINATRKHLKERFHERREMLLLNLFLKSKEPIDVNVQDTDGVTLLHLSAMRSTSRLAYLIEEGSDPSILTKDRRNALHLACTARQSNVVAYLCKNYPNMIHQKDASGKTPLHTACRSGQLESVYLLLEAGADLTVTDELKRTALHSCAEFAEEQKVWDQLPGINGAYLKDRFRPNIPESNPNHGPWYTRTLSPLLWNVPSQPNIGLVVTLLLNASSDPMATDLYSSTPLDLALNYDCQEMIQQLEFLVPELIKKCEKKENVPKLETILTLKRSNGSALSRIDLDVTQRQQLLNNLPTYFPLLSFADIAWLAKYGGNIVKADGEEPIVSSGNSMLYFCASSGFTSLMGRYGAQARINDDPKVVMARVHEQLSVDPKVKIEIGSLSPALHIACARNFPNMDMVRVLVEKCGVEINARAVALLRQWAPIAEAVEGGTALHVLAEALSWWQVEALQYLVERGANVDAINERGETPLHIACTGTTFEAMNCGPEVFGYWRIEAVNLLLAAGANVNHLDGKGLSCLHKACSSPKIMKILLKSGADINLGVISPMFAAIQIQCLETLTILLDAGVSPNVEDSTVQVGCSSYGNETFHLDYKAKGKMRTALFCASFPELHNQREWHQAPLVKRLIERGADIYAEIDNKNTLLHYVFENAAFEIVEAFLDCAPKVDIDLNNRDALGRTVFIASCDWIGSLPGYQGNLWRPKKKASFLRAIELGADPLVLDNDGRNALHHLLDKVNMEDEAIIQFLALDCAKTLLNQKDKDGFTPLNCALRILRPSVVEVMITMGQDLLGPDPTGATALHRIAEQVTHTKFASMGYTSEETIAQYQAGALALWKKFLPLGGSINVRDVKGAPPIFYFLSAAEEDRYKVPDDWCCHLEYFPKFFDCEDLDFQAKNDNGENALHIIAKRAIKKKTGRKEYHAGEHVPTHNKDLYQFFVRKGLNPLEEDGNGRSSLDVAAACEQKGILELFQYGK